MNPLQALFFALGFKHRNEPFTMLKILFFTGIIMIGGLYLIFTLITITSSPGDFKGGSNNHGTYNPTPTSEQTSSNDLEQQPNQNYTSQSSTIDTTRMVVTQPAIQVDTTKMMSVDTINQIQTSNGVVNSINNKANATIIDDNKKDIIEKYLKGQDNRNFEEFAQYYAPNIRRNWEMYNPTLSQIQGEIYHLWSVTLSSSQTISTMEMINDSTIKADVLNTYTTRKKNLTKAIDYNIYFVFDSNNQIVETYGFENK